MKRWMMVAMLATSMLGGAQAQQISGKEVDAEDNPVAYANVVMSAHISRNEIFRIMIYLRLFFCCIILCKKR